MLTPNWVKVAAGLLAALGGGLMQLPPNTIAWKVGAALVGLLGGAGVISSGLQSPKPPGPPTGS